MYKWSKLALIATLISHNVMAEEYSLIEKDSFGTGIYYEGTVVNNEVFVNSGFKKIDRFNISIPTALVRKNDLATSCTNTFSNIVNDGNIVAYVCDQKIEFIDVTDSDNIKSVGSYDSTSYAINDMLFEGGLLYVLGGNSEFLVFDVTDLTNIVELGRANVGEVNDGGMIKIGNYVYAINQLNTIDIYEVSDPELPVIVANHPAVGTSFFSFEVVADHIYIGSSAGLQVVDISNPLLPSLVSTVSLDANTDSFSAFKSMVSAGAHFIAVSAENTIYSIDISTPNSPIVSAPKFTLKENVRDIQINGNTLVVMNGVDGIRTIDLSDLDLVVELDHYTNSMAPTNISLDNNKALVADEEGVYHVIELDSELKIREAGRVSGYFNNSGGLLKDDIARISKNNEITTLNISNLTAPFRTDIDYFGSGSISAQGKFEEQFVVGSSTADLGVYNILTNSLIEVLNVNLGVDAISNIARGVIDITKKGDNLFVTTRETDMTIVNISDIFNPTINHFEWSAYDDFDRHIEVFGSRAFIARNSGLMVIDISNPASPQYLKTDSSFGIPDTIQAIDESHAIIASDSTIYLVDFQDETLPVIIDEGALGMRVTDLAGDMTKILASEKMGARLKSFQVNQAPTSTNSSATLDEDVLFNGLLSINDRENDSFTVSITQNPVSGSLTVENDGSYSYQPNNNYFGSDNFIFEVTGLYGKSTSSSVELTINPINDAPIVDTVELNVDEDNVLTATLIASDIEASEITFDKISEPASGSLTITETGNVTYTPTKDFFGQVSFDVKANDGELDSEIKTIIISVTAVNDIPVVEASGLILDEDTIAVGNASATDVDSNSFTFSLLTNATNGSAIVNSNGSYSYTPNLNFNGSDSFTLIANDTVANSEPVTVGVIVSPINDAPVVSSNNFNINEDYPLSASVSAIDVENDGLTFRIINEPSNGVLTLSENGSFTYIPEEDYFGNIEFDVIANDGELDSMAKTITISITPVNDIPVIEIIDLTLDEDDVVASNVLVTDVDSSSFTFSLITNGENGNLVLNSDGSYSYTPNLNFNGGDSFTLMANDGLANSEPVTFNVMVSAINDTPTAVNAAITTEEDTKTSGQLVASDVDNDELDYELITNVTNGVLTLDRQGEFSYTPVAGYSGADSFTYSAKDPSGESATAKVSITVTAKASGGGSMTWLILVSLLLGTQRKKFFS